MPSRTSCWSSGVVVTIAVGLEAGLVWAFVGGLALDVLAHRPLGSTAFALLLCVGGASVLGRCSSAFDRSSPIVAVPVLSLVYSMILFVAFGALGAADPGRRPAPARPAGRRLRRRPRRADRAARDRRPRSAGRAGAGGLVNTTSTVGPSRPGGLSRFLVFGLVVMLIAVSGLTARLFYLQIANGGRVRHAVGAEPDGPRGDRGAARPHLRPQGPRRSSPTSRRSPSRSARPTCRSRGATRSSSGWPRCSPSTVADINAAIDGNPGSAFDLVRVAQRRRRGRRPC